LVFTNRTPQEQTMAKKKVHRKQITFEIFTKGPEALEITESELEALMEALEQGIKASVDMRYNVDYSEGHHELIGVDIVAVSK
jgi:hypothetical protein